MRYISARILAEFLPFVTPKHEGQVRGGGYEGKFRYIFLRRIKTPDALQDAADGRDDNNDQRDKQQEDDFFQMVPNV